MFTGLGVAIVTPFCEGQLDIPNLKILIEWQIRSGTQALIVLGTTGEAVTLSPVERELVIHTAVEVAAGRRPVIVGIGSNATSNAITFAEQAEQLGADGLLLITPYYNKTSKNGLEAHFRAVAAASRLPIILYNVPSRTGMNLTPDVLFNLRDVSNIVGVKDASGDVGQILEIRRLRGPGFAIYSGNDDQVVATLACGGQGVISVAANIIPQEMQQMCAHFLAGEIDQALQLQLAYKPLVDALFCEPNPIPVKMALCLQGYIGPELRLPLVPLSSDNVQFLTEQLQLCGLC